MAGGRKELTARYTQIDGVDYISCADVQEWLRVNRDHMAGMYSKLDDRNLVYETYNLLMQSFGRSWLIYDVRKLERENQESG